MKRGTKKEPKGRLLITQYVGGDGDLFVILRRTYLAYLPRQRYRLEVVRGTPERVERTVVFDRLSRREEQRLVRLLRQLYDDPTPTKYLDW